MNLIVMFCVYLLQSLKDDTWYVGQTGNVSARLGGHNDGKVISTRRRTPWKLIGFEEYNTREEARFREFTLKKSYWQKKKFIKSLLNQADKN